MPNLLDLLTPWMPAQRWFAGKGAGSTLERIGGFRLATASGEARVGVHFVLAHSAQPLLYQVPLTERDAPVDGLAHALVGTIETDGHTTWVYDGTHDPAGAEAILRLVLDESTALPDDGAPGIAARGHRAPGVPVSRVVGSRVLSGEQSNTSIIFDVADDDGTPGEPVICKVFRSLHHGDNPDVTLLSALGVAGSTVVPRSIGHITGEWRDSARPTGIAHGHLAFAQEFLPGVEDAWRVAVSAAAAGDDFATRARALGEATADVHVALARALPTHETGAAEIAGVVSSMRSRFDQAVEEVPALAEHRDALESVYSRISASAWPPMQRIHGDYHLGQVLSVPERGWVILDFEGEPLRPMHERSVEDSPLRDVAGMLRSFDYVAGSVSMSDPAASPEGWAADARASFVEGYAARSGRDLLADRALLDAFEIDKALYEAVYEARNRPSWLPIPLDAIGRLVDRASRA
ncbi:maltokinase N-terminal cap-like domain-containing protein [Marisediminicola sp. LYQ134]|uniref:maltokinase N-terminal cap-like domain-containing protein n=1 Tax=Marisediminicola sp. LYQ134 TaxID=3391061 RepID=UPI003982F401